MDEAFSEFAEMLEHAEWMFKQANDVLGSSLDSEEIKDSLYRRDQSINALLKSIRLKIVSHLSINPGSDVAASLALMSVAKDAERIGDYCKNVFEVGRFYTEGFHLAEYHGAMEAIRADVEGLFVAVRRAWKESDTREAKDAIKAADRIGNQCDALIEQLLGDKENIRVREGVAYSLLARHYKRVSSHLSNVCTAVLGKIELLDFRK